ncbi:hypothetical protein M0R45_004936 [Rubus argutus]|uniref:Uncharacterized protein n=1 Tax=Rubus argutus TaxID=59490 RepID=A0AAW1YLA5_RUBAR
MLILAMMGLMAMVAMWPWAELGAFGSVGKGFEGRGGNVALGIVGSELTGNGGSVVGEGVVGAVGKADFGKDGITGGRVGLVGGVGNGVDGNGGKVAFGRVGVGAEGSGGNAVLGKDGVVGTTGNAGGGAAAVSKRWRAAWLIWVLEIDNTATKDRTRKSLGEVMVEFKGAAKANLTKNLFLVMTRSQ